MKGKVVVLGVGNELMGDDGIGIHAVRLLRRTCPSDFEIVEVGTSPFQAVSALKDAHKAIVIDAIEGGGFPGTIYRCPLDQCVFNPSIASLHGLDIRTAAMLEGFGDASVIILLGIQPAYIGWSMELSQPVKEAIPALLKAVMEEAGCME
jgi:hydrogenase maturation protease